MSLTGRMKSLLLKQVSPGKSFPATHNASLAESLSPTGEAKDEGPGPVCARLKVHSGWTMPEDLLLSSASS